MKHRRRVFLVLVLLLLVGGLLLVPSIRWPVYGWLRGEVVYQGIPASWWERKIEESYVVLPTFGNLAEPEWLPPTRWTLVRPTSFWDLVQERLGLTTTTFTLEWPPPAGLPLLNGDPDALPMLLVLVESNNLRVRCLAISDSSKFNAPIPQLAHLTSHETTGISS
jgi:hypothetical protein